MTDPLPGRSPVARVLGSERGVGLPELLVAMTLLAILMTIVVSVFSSFTRALTLGEASTESTNVASVGMNEVTRVIRAGTEIERLNNSTNLPVFVTAKREEAVLHAYTDASALNPAPLLIQLKVDPTGRDLVERRWKATKDTNGYWTFPNHATAAPASSRVVARQIVVPKSGEASFLTYLKTVGCPVETPTCAIEPASGDQLTEAEIALIVAVEVTIKVQADESERAEPVTITNRVGIPNLGRSRVGL